jgi:hypothetical protein
MFFACSFFLAIQFVVVAMSLPQTKAMTFEEVAVLWK